ncbi:MAG: ubiquinone biosynthesis protein [Thermoplasmata archaeon]|jgi:ubiquinone biosynthesis protein|nr:ubiquinone biosynthesis protein [Thermoplasmata archaeon]
MADERASSDVAASAAEEKQRKISKLQRTVEISRVLYENDFFRMMRDVARAERVPGDVVGTMELVVPADAPRRVRRMLEQLGPTFIKIGQLLGTRPDLVSKPFLDEFRHLYDRTTASPFPAIKALIESELGRPMKELFEEFDEVPIASASVGQVHFATLRGGERVAVKVQHPGIEERVRVDFEIMEPMVRFVENLFAASRVWQPREHLLEVQQMLYRELDYRNEAKNVQRIRDAFEDDATVKIPQVYWHASSRRVLTLERIEGVKFSDFDNPELKALDGKRLARIITYAMAKQIFEVRFFHADPSPGNLMAMGSDQVAFLDWGAVGSVSRRRSERILALILGFVRSDLDGVAQALLDICRHGNDVDMGELMRDMERIMDYHERERASVGDPVVLEMILDVANKHNMLLPPDFMLITRALFQFEGLCKKLDPRYELVDVLEPYVFQYLRKEAFSVGDSGEKMLSGALEALDAARHFPARVNKVLRMLENNEVRVRVDMDHRGQRLEREERRNLRNTFTALVAALVLGIAWIMAAGNSAALVPFLFTAVLFVLIWAFFFLYWTD